MSLTGLFCSIVFTFLPRNRQNRIEHALNRLRTGIERRLVFVSLEDIGVRQLKAATEQREHMRQIGTSMMLPKTATFCSPSAFCALGPISTRTRHPSPPTASGSPMMRRPACDPAAEALGLPRAVDMTLKTDVTDVLDAPSFRLDREF